MLEQQAAQVGAAGIMGSDHTYVIPGAEEPRRAGAAARKRCAPPAGCLARMPNVWSHGLANLGRQAHDALRSTISGKRLSSGPISALSSALMPSESTDAWP